MMKLKCALCGRPTVPYAMIGNMAVGPKCAARAGLLKGKVPKGSAVRFVPQPGKRSTREPETMDMFSFDDDGSLAEPVVTQGGA